MSSQSDSNDQQKERFVQTGKNVARAIFNTELNDQQRKLLSLFRRGINNPPPSNTAKENN